MEKLRFNSPSVLISFLQIAMILLSALAINYFLDPQGNAGKFSAGFFIGSFMMITKETLKHYVPLLLRLRLPNFNSRKLINVGMHAGVFIILAFMGLMSVLGWYVSWEGVTKVFFGLGFLLAGFITDYGFAKMLSHEAALATKA
jgi:hypothetical protein